MNKFDINIKDLRTLGAEDEVAGGSNISDGGTSNGATTTLLCRSCKF